MTSYDRVAFIATQLLPNFAAFIPTYSLPAISQVSVLILTSHTRLSHSAHSSIPISVPITAVVVWGSHFADVRSWVLILIVLLTSAADVLPRRVWCVGVT